MSRHSRQDYHTYNQQTHPRWSVSPPLNRISNQVDPRLASRMGTAQDMQVQAHPISQMNQSANPAAAAVNAASASASGADIVQAIQAMNAQMTGQLSMMETQLASLVSLTSRLIEISQLSHQNGGATDPSRSRTDAMKVSGMSRATSPHTTAVDAAMSTDTSPNNVRDRAPNGSLADGVTMLNSSSDAARPETRSGPFYTIPSNYRGVEAAGASSLERATFGSTLRGASPSNSSPSGLAPGSLAHARATAADASDSHKSRLPSPVFVDDPIGMTADVSAPAQSANNTVMPRRQQADASAGSNAARAGDSNSSSKKDGDPAFGDWKVWVDHAWRPSGTEPNRNVKYRTMQSARRAHKDMTKRSMATLGRLPLKEFLEIKSEQYLNVRKTGRKVYQEWLHQEVRLAKQPNDRLRAAINRIEHEHPALGDCNDHWKAKQLLQQIIDNAIDEANLHRKKEARKSNASNLPSSENTNSTPRTGNSVGKHRSNSILNENTKKATAPPTAKAVKAGSRRKADQAELEETPSRFRAPPASLHAETTLSSSRRIDDQSLHAQHSLSSGMDNSSHNRSLADYSNYGNTDATGMASVTSDQTRGGNDNQGWPNTQASTSSLFSQSSYHQQQQQAVQQQQHQMSQAYGNHHENTHAPHYLSSESHHHHHAPSGAGLGSSSSLLEPSSHDGHRAHSHSHLSPLVNGGVRLTTNTASAPNAFSFDYRHHAG